MSKIIAEQLLAGIILGDRKNREFIYLPGGEVGVENPYCVFEKDGRKQEDLPLEDAVRLAARLHLVPASHPSLGKKAY